MNNTNDSPDANHSAPTGGLNTRRIVISGVLGAIAILLGWTRIGYIPVPNIAGSATIMHIPVIIGAVLEGPLVGTILGAIFGLSSFFLAADPIFKDPLVAIVPRLFIGVTSYFAYVAVKKSNRTLNLGMVAIVGILAGLFVHTLLSSANQTLALVLAIVAGVGIIIGFGYLVLHTSADYLPLVAAAVVGTFTNGILVLFMIWLRGYFPWAVLLPVLATNTVAEAIIAVILVVAVVTAWQQIGSGGQKAKM